MCTWWIHSWYCAKRRRLKLNVPGKKSSFPPADDPYRRHGNRTATFFLYCGIASVLQRRKNCNENEKRYFIVCVWVLTTEKHRTSNTKSRFMLYFILYLNNKFQLWVMSWGWGFLECKLSQIQYRGEMLCNPKLYTLNDNPRPHNINEANAPYPWKWHEVTTVGAGQPSIPMLAAYIRSE